MSFLGSGRFIPKVAVSIYLRKLRASDKHVDRIDSLMNIRYCVYIVTCHSIEKLVVGELHYG